MYGQRKPIAQRTPLIPSNISRSSLTASGPPTRPRSRSETDPDLSTPGATEGETSDPDSELDTEVDEAYTPARSITSSKDKPGFPQPMMTLHDLMNLYFRKDTLMLHNLDIFRYFRLLLSQLCTKIRFSNQRSFFDSPFQKQGFGC